MAPGDYATQVGGSLDAFTCRFNSGERSNRRELGRGLRARKNIPAGVALTTGIHRTRFDRRLFHAGQFIQDPWDSTTGYKIGTGRVGDKVFHINSADSRRTLKRLDALWGQLPLRQNVFFGRASEGEKWELVVVTTKEVKAGEELVGRYIF